MANMTFLATVSLSLIYICKTLASENMGKLSISIIMTLLSAVFVELLSIFSTSCILMAYILQNWPLGLDLWVDVFFFVTVVI